MLILAISEQLHRACTGSMPGTACVPVLLPPECLYRAAQSAACPAFPLIIDQLWLCVQDLGVVGRGRKRVTPTAVSAASPGIDLFHACLAPIMSVPQTVTLAGSQLHMCPKSTTRALANACPAQPDVLKMDWHLGH